MIGCWSSLLLAALRGRLRLLIGQGVGLGSHLVRLSVGCVVGRNRRLRLEFMTAGQPASLAGVESISLLSSVESTRETDALNEVFASRVPRRHRQITRMPSQPRPRESTGQHFSSASSAWGVASLMRRCAGPLPPPDWCVSWIGLRQLVAPPPPPVFACCCELSNTVIGILN